MPVAVSVSMFARPTSATFWVKGLMIGIFRRVSRRASRKSRPTPTLNRSASLKPTVGFTDMDLRFVIWAMKRPGKRSRSAQSVLQARTGVWTPSPKTTRSENWWV